MTSDTTEAGQLSIPLGADVFWADLANAENRRGVDATKEQASSNEVYTLIPLEQWRQDQIAQLDTAVNEVLQEGHLYDIDGGVFKAKHDEDGRWELWVWQGRNGNEVTRTGFEVDEKGGLYDRLYDVVAEEWLILIPARFNVISVSHTLLMAEHNVIQASKSASTLRKI